MLTSLPEPPRPRPRLTDPAEPLDGHPYRHGAEVITADGRSLPLVSAKLRGSARGGIARLVLEQRFENRHAETLCVTYRMPLPADGAVSGYAFVIADRTIVGQVSRKQDARERFEHAVAAGHTAALLEQEHADIFTQSIGNLPPGQALIARITVDQRLTWLPEGEWELRFPTVIGPRYVSASDRPEDVRGTRVATAPGGVTARIQIAIAIDDTLSAGRKPTSPSHALTIANDGVIELADLAGARLDRDVVLRWPVAGPTTGMSLAMMRPEQGEECFGLVTIVPPEPAAVTRTFARDLIVLIDTSGSMEGRPLDKAKQVIALLIESLGDADRLELIEFSSEPRRYKPAPVPATRGEKRAAIRWLRGLSAGGGTEMQTAVGAALQLLRPDAQRQVVIATDGYVGGESRLVAALHAGLPASSRLHFIGIGSSVNRSLATAMARAGRGAEVICDLDGDPERAVKRLIDRTRSPIATDITIEGSALIHQAPEALPDVFAASPLVAAVKLRAGDLVVRGQTLDGEWVCRLRVTPPRSGDGNPAIATLFGRERVADLEARSFAGESHDAEIERLGLVFQIATRFTAFVAIDEALTHRVGARVEVVPQELPYGTTAAAFGLRGSPLGVASMSMLDHMELLDEAEQAAGSAPLVEAPPTFMGDFSEAAPAEGDPTLLGGPSFDDPQAFTGQSSAELSDDVDMAVAFDASELSSLRSVRSERPSEPTVPVTATRRPGAPAAPPDPKADRLARIARAMKPRGLADVARGKPAPDLPDTRDQPKRTLIGAMAPAIWPATGPIKPLPGQPSPLAKPEPAAPVSVSPDAPTDRLEVLESRSAIPSSLPALDIREPHAMDQASVARRRRLMLLALLAILALLAALLWWLVA